MTAFWGLGWTGRPVDRDIHRQARDPYRSWSARAARLADLRAARIECPDHRDTVGCDIGSSWRCSSAAAFSTAFSASSVLIKV